MQDSWLVNDWATPLRVLVVGVLAYIALVILLLATGKRTLSKLNAFDLVITVSLGSTLSAILVNQQISFVDGVTAFSVLVSLQLLVTWTSVRSALVRRLVKAEPALLLHHGAFLRDAMRRERVTEDEVRAAIRAAGVPTPAAVSAVVLETDGSLSVIPEPNGDHPLNLEGVGEGKTAPAGSRPRSPARQPSGSMVSDGPVRPR